MIAGAAVSVHYSRPQLRGRVIFGSLVPWGEVWRTGANAATMLTTTADLIIEDNLIPAGTYSVWTIPQPDRWVLILNSQTGQWGTEYDPNQDLVRIPIPVEFTEWSVEAFTISVQQSGSGDGILSFEWDDVRASVTFTPAG